MAYDEKLAGCVREALAPLPKVEEKRLFGGLAFLVDGKMCVNVSGNELMCRFDPALQHEAAERPGFRTMIMKGKELKGYGYVSAGAIKEKKDFDYWMNLCLSFNTRARPSKKKTN